MQLSLSTHLFVRETLDQGIINLIKNYGFNFAEIWGAYPHLNYHRSDLMRETARYFQRKKIKVLSFHAPFYLNREKKKEKENQLSLSAVNPLKREITLKEIKRVLEVMSCFGSKLMIIHGGVSLAEKDGEDEENLCRSIQELLDYTKGENIKFALENTAKRAFQMDNLVRMVDKFSHPNLGICIDLGHSNLVQNPSEAIKLADKRIFSLHVSDNYGKKDDHLVPLKGNIPWQDVCDSLAEISYQGPFTLELIAHEQEYSEILPEAVVNLKKILS